MQLEHPALLHEGRLELLDHVGPFIAQGAGREEPVLVVVGHADLAALRDAVGMDTPTVTWHDTVRWHPRTGTRLRAFYEYVMRHIEEGATHVRIVGEPVWPREPEHVREWQRYESVLNHVLAELPVTLLCTYDTTRVDPSIVDVAKQTHPEIRRGAERSSLSYVTPAEFLAAWAHDVAPAPPTALQVTNVFDLAGVREAVLVRARASGLDEDRAQDVCLAASEIVTNALVHGGASVDLAMWVGDGSFVCQIEDRGRGIADPFAGYRPPDPAAMNGRGLWLARQMVDLLQIGPSSPGAVVRLLVRIPAARD